MSEIESTKNQKKLKIYDDEKLGGGVFGNLFRGVDLQGN